MRGSSSAYVHGTPDPCSSDGARTRIRQVWFEGACAVRGVLVLCVSSDPMHVRFGLYVSCAVACGSALLLGYVVARLRVPQLVVGARVRLGRCLNSNH